MNWTVTYYGENNIIISEIDFKRKNEISANKYAKLKIPNNCISFVLINTELID